MNEAENKYITKQIKKVIKEEGSWVDVDLILQCAEDEYESLCGRVFNYCKSVDKTVYDTALSGHPDFMDKRYVITVSIEDLRDVDLAFCTGRMYLENEQI